MITALLLIDFQNDFLKAKTLRPHSEVILHHAALLLSEWRKASLPIFHIWTTVHWEPDDRMEHWKRDNYWACVEGTAGHATPLMLEPKKGETVIHKRFFSAFSGDGLPERLRAEKVKRLILAGVHLHGCIRSTMLDAYAEGFQVVVAQNAVGGYDAVHSAISEEYLDERAGFFKSSEKIIETICNPENLVVASENRPEIISHFPPLSPQRTQKWSVASKEEISQFFFEGRLAWERWQTETVQRRDLFLKNFAVELEGCEEELAEMLVQDVGKPVTLAVHEVRRSIDLVRSVLRHFPQENIIPTSGNYWRRAPVGIIAMITPFNNPLAIPIGKIVPALLFGNVVIWKPALPGIRIALRVTELLRSASIPAGTVQVVVGGIREARECMSLADSVTISGSPGAGQAAQLICARRSTPLQAELGGNNAAIVWRDADLENAATSVLQGAFAFAGQRCTANRRVIVDAAVYDEFALILQRGLARFLPDDPRRPGVVIGPLISPAALDRVRGIVRRAREAGCHIISIETTPWVKEPSVWMQPVIVHAENPALEIVQEESFGPILVIQKADSWNYAIELCNGVRQGLVAACFTSDELRVSDFLSRVKCGILKINQSTADADADLPFGGWKSSGLGPAEHGPANVEFYTRPQTIYR